MRVDLTVYGLLAAHLTLTVYVFAIYIERETERKKNGEFAMSFTLFPTCENFHQITRAMLG